MNQNCCGNPRKAEPLRKEGNLYIACLPQDATHLRIRLPGPTGRLTLPIVTGITTRSGTGCWSWNESVEFPTLRPSVLTQYEGADGSWRCHSWINDGTVQFLGDCSHELAGKTLPLLDVDENEDDQEVETSEPPTGHK